jgi:radical SAM protein with 4Fe4S-binding SPASM domain
MRNGAALLQKLSRGVLQLATLVRSPLAREAFANNVLKEFSYTHGLVRSLGHPQLYQLETTNQCPYTCISCPRTYSMQRPVGHMDIGLFRSIVDQVRPAWQLDNLRDEAFLGLWLFGEPTVYRHFAESIEYCHEKKFSACISTNPSVWTERRIDIMLETGLDAMFVTMDGMDDETSMAIRGKVASYTRGEQNLRQLTQKKVALGRSKPVIHLNMVKQPRNAHQWELFRSHWEGVEGIDSITLSTYSTFSGDVPEINAVGMRFAEQDAEQAKAVALQRYFSSFACYYPWHSVSVMWDGKVVPCCRDYDAGTVLGDLKTESLEAIWNGPPMMQLREEFRRGKLSKSPCSTCTERSAEMGLPGKYYPGIRPAAQAAGTEEPLGERRRAFGDQPIVNGSDLGDHS